MPNELNVNDRKSMTHRYNELLEFVKNDPKVLGLVLGGSRGKGLEKENSDYDCRLIVKPDVLDQYKEQFKNYNSNIDLGVYTLDELREYAEWGTEYYWDRYDFAHTTAVIDKTKGELQRIINQKGQFPKDVANKFVYRHLDSYINSVYRSMKCLRDHNYVGFRHEASASIPPLLEALFALHGRVNPFLKYLLWELETYPLPDFPWSAHQFSQMLLQILNRGNYSTQQKLLKGMEQLFRKKGFSKVFDDWDGDDQWAMTYQPKDSSGLFLDPPG